LFTPSTEGGRQQQEGAQLRHNGGNQGLKKIEGEYSSKESKEKVESVKEAKNHLLIRLKMHSKLKKFLKESEEINLFSSEKDVLFLIDLIEREDFEHLSGALIHVLLVLMDRMRRMGRLGKNSVANRSRSDSKSKIFYSGFMEDSRSRAQGKREESGDKETKINWNLVNLLEEPKEAGSGSHRPPVQRGGKDAGKRQTKEEEWEGIDIGRNLNDSGNSGNENVRIHGSGSGRKGGQSDRSEQDLHLKIISSDSRGRPSNENNATPAFGVHGNLYNDGEEGANQGRNLWENRNRGFGKTAPLLEHQEGGSDSEGLHEKGDGLHGAQRENNNKWIGGDEELNYSDDRRDSSGHREQGTEYEEEGNQWSRREDGEDGRANDRVRYMETGVIREETEEERSGGPGGEEEGRARRGLGGKRGRTGGLGRSRSQVRGGLGEMGDVESGEDSPSVSQENYEGRAEAREDKRAKQDHPRGVKPSQKEGGSRHEANEERGQPTGERGDWRGKADTGEAEEDQAYYKELYEKGMLGTYLSDEEPEAFEAPVQPVTFREKEGTGLEPVAGKGGKSKGTGNKGKEAGKAKVQEGKGLNKSGQSKTRHETENTRAGDITTLADLNGQLESQGKGAGVSFNSSYNQDRKGKIGAEATSRPKIKSKEREKTSSNGSQRQNSDSGFGKTTLFGEQKKDKFKEEDKYALPVSKPLFSSSKTKEDKYPVPKPTTGVNKPDQKLKLFEDKPKSSNLGQFEIGSSQLKKSKAEKSKDKKKTEQASQSLANFSKKTSVAEVDLSSDQKRNRTEELGTKKIKAEIVPKRLDTLKTEESNIESQIASVSIAKKKGQSSLTNSLSTDKLFKTFDSKIPSLNPPKKDSALFKESAASVQKKINLTDSTEMKNTTLKDSSKKNTTRNFDSVLKSKEGSTLNQKSGRDLTSLQSPGTKVKTDTNQKRKEQEDSLLKQNRSSEILPIATISEENRAPEEQAAKKKESKPSKTEFKKSGPQSSVGDLMEDLKKSRSKEIAYKPFDTVRSSKQDSKPKKNAEKNENSVTPAVQKPEVSEPTRIAKVTKEISEVAPVIVVQKESLAGNEKNVPSTRGRLEKSGKGRLFEYDIKRDSSSQSNQRSDRLKNTQKSSLFEKPAKPDKNQLSLQKSVVTEPEMNLNNISKIPESNQELFEDENSQVMSGLENMFKSNIGTKKILHTKNDAKKTSIHLQSSKPNAPSKTSSIKKNNSVEGLFDRKKENTTLFKKNDSVKSQSKQSSLVSPRPKNILESKVGQKKASEKSSISSAVKLASPQGLQMHKRDSSLKSLMSSNKRPVPSIPKHRSEANIHEAKQISTRSVLPTRKLAGYQLQSISEKSAFTKPKQRSSAIAGLVKPPSSKPLNLDLKRSKLPGESLLKKKEPKDLLRPKRSVEATSSISRYTSESAKPKALRNSLSNTKLNVLKSLDKPKFLLNKSKADFRSNLSGDKATKSRGSIPMPKLTVSPTKLDMKKNPGNSQGSIRLNDLFGSQKKQHPKPSGITAKQSQLKKIVGHLDLPKKSSSSIGSSSNPLFSARRPKAQGAESSRRLQLGSNQSSLANLRKRDSGLIKQSAPNLTAHLLQSSSAGKLQVDSSLQKPPKRSEEKEIKVENTDKNRPVTKRKESKEKPNIIKKKAEPKRDDTLFSMNSKIFKTMDSRVSKNNKKETERPKNPSIVDKSSLLSANTAVKPEVVVNEKNSKKTQAVEQKAGKRGAQAAEKTKIGEKEEEKNTGLIEKEKGVNSGKKSGGTRLKQVQSTGLLFEEPKKKKGNKPAKVDASKNSISAVLKKVSNEKDSDTKNANPKAEAGKTTSQKIQENGRKSQEAEVVPKMKETKEKGASKEPQNSRGLLSPPKSNKGPTPKSKRGVSSSSAGIRFDPLSNTKPISALFSVPKDKGSAKKLKTSEQDLKGPRRTIEEMEHESNEDSDFERPVQQSKPSGVKKDKVRRIKVLEKGKLKKQRSRSEGSLEDRLDQNLSDLSVIRQWVKDVSHKGNTQPYQKEYFELNQSQDYKIAFEPYTTKELEKFFVPSDLLKEEKGVYDDIPSRYKNPGPMRRSNEQSFMNNLSSVVPSNVLTTAKEAKSKFVTEEKASNSTPTKVRKRDASSSKFSINSKKNGNKSPAVDLLNLSKSFAPNGLKDKLNEEDYSMLTNLCEKPKPALEFSTNYTGCIGGKSRPWVKRQFPEQDQARNESKP
jgi:hypothetical protein